MEYICYVDGGYNIAKQGSGYGSYAIYLEEQELFRSSRFELKEANSNNEAEYMALERLLFDIKTLDKENVEWIIYSDSLLMVNQLTGVWKINKANLKSLFSKTSLLISGLESIKIYWVSRKKIVKVLGH